jgi:hypothetical protein
MEPSRARTSSGQAAGHTSSQRQGARTRGTIHGGQTLLYRASELDCYVCPSIQVLPKRTLTQDPSRSPRARRGATQDGHKVARRLQGGRDAPNPDRKAPNVISPRGRRRPTKRVQFGLRLNYLFDIVGLKHATASTIGGWDRLPCATYFSKIGCKR